MQLFRKDLISAMKLPDTEVLQYDEYFLIGDTWKLEWERGVQVPVDIDAVPPLVVGSVTSTAADVPILMIFTIQFIVSRMLLFTSFVIYTPCTKDVEVNNFSDIYIYRKYVLSGILLLKVYDELY